MNNDEKLYLEKLRISEKIDDLIKSVAKLTETVEFQNGRIAKLENWRFFLMGMGVVITLLIIPIFLSIINLYVTIPKP